MSQPRGIRNNNPGNIDYDPKTHWEGCAGIEAPPLDGSRARFCHFADMAHGVRALAKILRNYIALDGVAPTVRAIISRWAPSGENDTAAYIADVARRMHVGPDDRLTLSAVDTLTRLVWAVIAHEVGDIAAAQIVPADVTSGINMVLTGA